VKERNIESELKRKWKDEERKKTKKRIERDREV
jgi:hypothetical protein